MLTALTERSSLELSPNVDLQRYDDPLYDRSDYQLSAAYRHSIDEDSEFTLTANAMQDSTLTSELGTTGISFLNKEREVRGGGASYVRRMSERDTVMVGASSSSINYVDAKFTSLVDYDYTTAYAMWNTIVNDRLTLGMLVNRSESSAPSTGARDETRTIQFTGSYQITENVKAEVALGRGHLDSQGAGDGDTRVYDLKLTGRGERWNWRAGASQSYQPTGYGVQSKQLRIDGSVSRQMSENFELALNLAGIQTDEGFGGSNEVTYLRGSLNGTWRVGRAWYLQFGVAHSEQRRQLTGSSALGNVISVGIAWRGDRRPLGGP